MLPKQDQSGVRTPEDVLRRINLADLKEALELVEKIRKEMIVDNQLSTTSTSPVQNKVITGALNQKVTKVDGKGLSTNDFTNEYKLKLDTKVADLTDNKVSALEINHISCITKDNRVCIDFSGSIDLIANTLTTIFTLPAELIPSTEKSFIAVSEDNIGYGIVDINGNIQIKFSKVISNTTIKFAIIYDLEEV